MGNCDWLIVVKSFKSFKGRGCLCHSFFRFCMYGYDCGGVAGGYSHACMHMNKCIYLPVSEVADAQGK